MQKKVTLGYIIVNHIIYILALDVPQQGEFSLSKMFSSANYTSDFFITKLYVKNLHYTLFDIGSFEYLSFL